MKTQEKKTGIKQIDQSFEISTEELRAKMQKLMDVANDLKMTPTEFLFVLEMTANEIKEQFGIVIQNVKVDDTFTN